MIPVILSGGSGTRLWPLSRSLYPKQFLPLFSGQTMFQETISRLDGIPGIATPLVVCNEDHRFIVTEQLRQMGIKKSTIVLEPIGRNTAPAITVAALTAIASGEDPILLVLAADHVILEVSAFQAAIGVARSAAEQGALVTFGIKPTAPETGYGYIKRSADHLSGTEAYRVAQFVEKPDLTTAKQYVASGEYFWNSGMFLFRCSALLAELELYAPEILTACRKAVDSEESDLNFLRLNAQDFSACPSDSIDCAVMEKTDKALVVPLDAGWNDVGSWSALWEVQEKDAAGNVSNGDVLSVNTRNSFLHSADGHLLVTVGLEDMVVVDTKDAVLIARRDQVQDVKKVVEELKAQSRKEATEHRIVYRPWGNYDAIDRGKRYQVKRITVEPGGRLSVQMHHHRAEHWIVVSGTAKVRNGEKEFLLTENQSTYIPVGSIHSLENPGKFPLEIIEVQSGAYLGEDDIVRLDDQYGRS